jgi:class 3 adenylate cyclase
MRVTRAGRLAVVLIGLTFAAFGGALATQIASNTWRFTESTLGVPALMAFSGVGLLIVRQRPMNSVGWLYLLSPLLFALAELFASLATVGRSAVAALPGQTATDIGESAVALLASAAVPTGFAGVAGLLLVPYLFPDGGPINRGWAALLAVFGLVAVIGVAALVTDPLARPAGGVVVSLFGYLVTLAALGKVVVIFAFLALGFISPVAVVARYVRAIGVERQQLRWFVYAAVVVCGWPLAFGPLVVITASALGLPDIVLRAVYPLPLVLIPAATGVAILRYHLYELDRLVNRSVAYGAASLLVLMAFLAVTAAAQFALAPVVGERSQFVAIVVAVGAAAIFQPLSRRAQGLADRLLPARAFLALLFTDIVGSTEIVRAVGDERWRSLLERYRTAVRRELSRHSGQEIDTAGDGFFVVFASPLDAVRCARAMDSAVQSLGLEARTGVHAGDVDMRGSRPTGLNVHVAARVMSAARPGSICISEDVHELLRASSLHFEDGGTHRLKGIAHPMRLFEAS